MTPKTDLDIAREIPLRPIDEIAEETGLASEDLIPYGKYIAKIPHQILSRYDDTPNGRVILVTAMSPTPRGEGKTTTTIGLGQAMKKTGRRAMMAIREPSLGPCMGIKGGAAGGGYSQVLPMEEINLHFTGDLHAITSAHNLLSAIVDNHLHQGNMPEINPRDIAWKRVIDMNDRSLRSIILGLEDRGRNGVMREDGFEITAASELMAILCLSKDLAELKDRTGRIIIGYDRLNRPVCANEIRAEGAIAALLKNAINPNLVQSIEGVPVLVHGGPFANIAHGCNSIIATKLARKLSDYVITEAGFGTDLGAEKFFNIKCRASGINPSAAVIVVTNRAYRLHGIDNIRKHVENILAYGIPAIISINRFADDSDGSLRDIQKACEDTGIDAVIANFREAGGDGGIELAEKTAFLCGTTSSFKPLYPLDIPIKEKIEIIAKRMYGAGGISFTRDAEQQVKRIEELGYGNLPVCIAKTQSSLTDNPKISGFPKNYFTITITGARVSAGAGFVVVHTGRIISMPGLPVKPAALSIDIDSNGIISGLF